MLNGDISNEVESSIAFRVDDSLFRLKRNAAGKVVDFELNKDVDRALRTVYFKTSFSLHLVSKLFGGNESEYREKLEELLQKLEIPYGELFIVKHDEEVRYLLTRDSFSYYIDIDAERLNLIGSEYAMGLSELYQFIRKRVLR